MKTLILEISGVKRR